MQSCEGRPPEHEQINVHTEELQSGSLQCAGFRPRGEAATKEPQQRTLGQLGKRSQLQSENEANSPGCWKNDI